MGKKIALNGLMLAATAVALWLTYRALSQFTLADIEKSLLAIPLSGFLLSLFFCALSYLCLTGFDYLGLIYAGRRLPWRKAAKASFTSLAIGHNIGLAALSSGAVRYRYYSRWGLRTEEIAKVILFCGATVGIGLIALGGICLVLLPESAAKLGGMGATIARWIGIGCLALIALYLVCCWWLRGTVKLFKWQFTLPDARLAVLQVLVGIANFASVAACLHWLTRAQAGYFETTTAYVMANLSALVAHVPGGLGVMEATISFLMGKDASIGALIAFRVVYFFIPLPLGAAVLAWSEWKAATANEKQSADAHHARSDDARLERAGV
ncbi:UPF0104 family protein [Rhizobium paknamense]|uniref:Uncharacterized membrane protein YbhN (UPF0104 family) n=1 Tax=Rhizobium paknamense TaxID=1206817 RepID=A0ABU0IBH3_9HYPH|nr:UPF0104 family protein [Rhizobium paknamense]MDQ0455560.1 uncharacterized membrane protein YbhN (UPF0104 family) [Rhizobium paknamense]